MEKSEEEAEDEIERQSDEDEEELDELGELEDNNALEDMLSACQFNKNDPLLAVIGYTKKYKPKLSHEGHFYTIDKIIKQNNNILWKCEQTGSKTKHKCLGRAQTVGYNKPVQITVDHNHQSDPIKEDVLILEAKMVQRAIQTNDDPRTIVKEILGKANKDTVSKMSRPTTLAQRIRRIRRSQKSYAPKNPDALDQIDIPESLRFTKRKSYFFMMTVE